jgi:hypothetical protein
VIIPSGTRLSLTLKSDLASDTSAEEDVVKATLASPISVGGETVIRSGAEVTGTVLSAKGSAKVKGLASLAYRFDHMRVNSENVRIQTATISEEAKTTKGKDAKKIGIGAGAGALIGGIAGGGKGAAIGTAIGAGAGTGAVLATKGEEVRIPAGTRVTTTLQEPLTITVPVKAHDGSDTEGGL